MYKRLSLDERAKLIFKNKKIELRNETDKAYYFLVWSLYDPKLCHDVIVWKDGTYSCTCKWFIYRLKKCSHIKACELFIQNRK